MRKQNRKIVSIQDDKERTGSESAYESYVDEHGESILGNPDLLPEQHARPSTPQLVMGEAIEHLQGRQKQVYMLVMREDNSLSEAGEALGITKATAQTHLDRAVNFIKAYCEEAMRMGRI